MALKVGVIVACLFAPALARAQDAGPDAGLDAGDDAGWDGGDGACRGDGDCNPGLRCIDGLCGVCGDGDSRDCDEGCGAGTQTCDFDNRYWGPCEPTVETECQIGDRLDCFHTCGAAHRPCEATSCTWSEDCIPDREVQCLPGIVTECRTPVTQCFGSRDCTDQCEPTPCVPDPTLCDCLGGPACCGNGAHDPDEECDGEPECGTNCTWAQARPFRSCDCRAPGTAAGSGAALAIAAALAGFARRRRR